MKQEEFNLSKEREKLENELIKQGLQIPQAEIIIELIFNQDKEFIKRLKEETDKWFFEKGDSKRFFKIIDTLVGDEFVK